MGIFLLQQAESLRVELERKLIVLKGQDAKNDERSSIDKTRAAIDALQTRMAVAIQAVDNCYSQVQKLRDDELYPQLLELLDGYENYLIVARLLYIEYMHRNEYRS